ncbi:AmpG family muropeptide MFS transporter [Candidatus Nitrosacidococcus sp. I8]|uniref:AmpG family muropeptide MFS transporter n=1 Tax=Candidatus Nitrosacidococcus sp. I8 TaxID=2942908 RepID=UPI002227CE9F|nr:AmpG family muropeptide MFS transporter [Candidatus Nitrosacidococcus sp. I8]CAH9019808.1 Anhydromuropeptide permease [Candidatus Nitrosacidococcus sp. I8]
MIIAFFMGFASGFPLLLTGSVLQAWMKKEYVDLSTIGLFSLVGLPYTLKFLWAPLLDSYTPKYLGRRRGWLLWAQIGLIITLFILSFTHPTDSTTIASVALLVTFFSALQDNIIDAYRRESLADHELGLGSAFYVNGYRLGMLVASAGGLILADYITFPQVYRLFTVIMLVGVITTLFAPEPQILANTPKGIKESITAPFKEYFSRPSALLILFFILFYKLGDSMAGHMTIPFYLSLGYSTSEIGLIVKGFGLSATLFGGILGGILMLKVSIYRALWIFGILQGLSILGFSLLAISSHGLLTLILVVSFENFTSGMGTTAYAAFMASLTHKQFTATQYALLSSFMGIPRVIMAAPTGFIAEYSGWVLFFFFCTLCAIPGLLLLRKLEKLAV